MRIETLKLTNFKAFKDVELKRLEPYSVFVGANGTGKTTLFDVFGFLRDCLRENVGAALAKRGGLDEVVSRGASERMLKIELKIRMRLTIGSRVVTYTLTIAERDGQPIVAEEVLRYTRFAQGKPYEFLRFVNGEGAAITNEAEVTDSESSIQRDHQKLGEPDILAIKGLGQFERFEAARAFRSLIENWHVSDFHIQSARASPTAGYAEHLSPEGENLPLVAQYLYRRHPQLFEKVMRKMRCVCLA